MYLRIIKHIKIIKLLTLIFLLLFSNASYSQWNKAEKTDKKDKKENKKSGKKIEILNADDFIFDESKGSDVRRLIGNVQIKHDGAIMYCDSAYVFGKNNNMNAYGRVRINKPGEMNIYGDKLFYDGNSGMAQVRNNVRLVDGEGTLTTNFFDYNIETGFGKYYNGGKIVQKSTVLTSSNGYYYSETHDYYFLGNVTMLNEDYNMKCDSLQYNTASEMVFFHGPTRITSDSSLIYCEAGWYNTKADKSMFKKKAFMEKDKQIVRADSLSYDKNTKIGIGYHNVKMDDEKEKMSLRAHKIIFYEKTDISVLTDSAVFIKYFDNDTIYLHGDTLKSFTDSSKNRIMRAYYNVKMYKSDFQAMCDSLIYSEKDSVINLYSNPVLWSNDNQMTADSIQIHTANNELSYFDMNVNAMIISEEDTIGYNQIRGKNIKGYFKNGELSRINVLGGGETIYYPKDDDAIIGLNNIKCSDMMIYVKEKEFKRIAFFKSPVAVLTPLKDVKTDMKTLQNFKWFGNYQPINNDDIFRKN
jgi:lipopolysaccharide export system protein LptA